MTDAHTHSVKTLPAWLCSAREEDWADAAAQENSDVRVFFGVHPWYAKTGVAEKLEKILRAHPKAGVGEIGLDRLREKTVSPLQRECFREQLEVAASLNRVVQLHGAKCWGEVVKECKTFKNRIPAFVFHGFSRSEGLLPEIFAMNGYVTVGAAILNDHAVNYRRLVANLPEERILCETDESTVGLFEIHRAAAEKRSARLEDFIACADENARRLFDDA